MSALNVSFKTNTTKQLVKFNSKQSNSDMPWVYINFAHMGFWSIYYQGCLITSFPIYLHQVWASSLLRCTCKFTERRDIQRNSFPSQHGGKCKTCHKKNSSIRIDSNLLAVSGYTCLTNVYLWRWVNMLASIYGGAYLRIQVKQHGFSFPHHSLIFEQALFLQLSETVYVAFIAGTIFI